MKLIGKLKDKVNAAESMAEKRNVIAEAGIELTEDELNAISGGAVQRIKSVKAICTVCKTEKDFNLVSGARGVCTVCGNTQML